MSFSNIFFIVAIGIAQIRAQPTENECGSVSEDQGACEGIGCCFTLLNGRCEVCAVVVEPPPPACSEFVEDMEGCIANGGCCPDYDNAACNDGECPPPPLGPPFRFGEFCYCQTDDVTEVSPFPTPQPTLRPTDSKGNTKKPGKNDGSSGLGIGDCDCDKEYGLSEFRLRYAGSASLTVDITGNYDKTEDSSGNYNTALTDCTELDVTDGKEFVCKIAVPYTKFDTNTYFTLTYKDINTDEIMGTEQCVFHTSCSSDIVGTYATAAADKSIPCDALFCTAWKDGNPTDGNDCNNGFVPCDCQEESQSVTCDDVNAQFGTGVYTVVYDHNALTGTAEDLCQSPALPECCLARGGTRCVMTGGEYNCDPIQNPSNAVSVRVSSFIGILLFSIIIVQFLF